MITAGPATPETEKRENERAELVALVRRIVREEMAAHRLACNESIPKRVAEYNRDDD